MARSREPEGLRQWRNRRRGLAGPAASRCRFRRLEAFRARGLLQGDEEEGAASDGQLGVAWEGRWPRESNSGAPVSSRRVRGRRRRGAGRNREQRGKEEGVLALRWREEGAREGLGGSAAVGMLATARAACSGVGGEDDRRGGWAGPRPRRWASLVGDR